MRLVLVGQASFGERVLEGLLADGNEVAAVYAPPAGSGKPDPLASAAERHRLSLRTPTSYRTAQVASEFAELGADLGVLAFVTKIIPEAVIAAPRLGTICFHPSLLPRYRGGSALAWQVIRGETRGGFTVFWTDAGIDTGPILLQREIAIDPDDTAGSLYFDKIFAPGVEGMVESVRLIARGTAPRIPQDEAAATYDPLCTEEHAAIDWSRPSREVYDLIRGCDPQPGAHSSLRGERVRLFSARRAEPAPAAGAEASPDPPPGTILRTDGPSVVVSAGRGPERGEIAIGRLRAAGAKMAASEFIAAAGARPGDRLGA
jgi:methionyl-tRNA formyltransferase